MKNQQPTLRPSLHGGVQALSLVLLLTACAPAQGQKESGGPPIEDPRFRYASLWIETEGESRIATTSTLSEILDLNEQYEQEGFRMVDFETGGVISSTTGDRRYAAVWYEKPLVPAPADPVHLHVDVEATDLAWIVGAEQTLAYQLVDLELYRLDNKLQVSALFHRRSNPSVYAYGLTPAALDAMNINQESQQRYLVDVESYGANGGYLYAAIWRADNPASEPIAVLGENWGNMLAVAAGLAPDRHLADLEFIAGPAVGAPWMATGLFLQPWLPVEALFPSYWDEIEDKHGQEGWLPLDIDLLYHDKGVVETGLTVSHDGPVVPPGS